MNNIILNLARKWRSKQFDQVIGQDLAVNLLKNSLFRNLVFPVYLFSGPKGSGKTSLARIFASSLNCDQLINFQNRPQNIRLPCLECASCLAMQKLAHADFIEIDAASHTGVDNIRHIIETASFVPVMGKKKIYLIDEAHMLSKSAFNALLKILEEPPPSTIFILATTDEHKIIETVKSRCFQLFFNSVSVDNIAKYLEFICTEEKIPFEKAGIDIIAQEAHGSVRDALNLIERIRLVNTSITKNVVFQTLGFLDEEHILELFKHIINQDLKQLLTFCLAINLKQFNSLIIFKRIIELIRDALLIKIFGQAEPSTTTTANNNIQNNLKENLDSIIKNCSSEHLITLLDLCCSYELIFTKSNSPELILEMLLIKLTASHALAFEKKNNNINTRAKEITKVQPTKMPKTENENLQSSVVHPALSASIQEAENLKEQSGTNRSPVKTNNLSQWQEFLLQLETLNDPLVLSIFKQAKVEQTPEKSNHIKLAFSKDLIFFQEWIENTKNIWKTIIDKCFNCDLTVTTDFNNEDLKIVRSETSLNNQAKQPLHRPTDTIESKTKKSESFSAVMKNKDIVATPRVDKAVRFDFSDMNKWRKANMLAKIFSGSILYRVG